MPDRVVVTIRWRHGLLGIADWLEQADEVGKLGLSRAATLVAEVAELMPGGGPGDAGLGELIWWVADAMEVCPPHEWSCPVVSRLEPERTAWTCRRCGRIAMSQDVTQVPES